MAKRFAKGGVAQNESSEYRMGIIEAGTYGRPAHKSGHSIEEAEALTIERGLYPFWLLGSELESKLDKGAHDAWHAGIKAGLKELYKRAPAQEKVEVSLPKNSNADQRQKEIAAANKPSTKARKEAIEKLRATPPKPAQGRKTTTQKREEQKPKEEAPKNS